MYQPASVKEIQSVVKLDVRLNPPCTRTCTWCISGKRTLTLGAVLQGQSAPQTTSVSTKKVMHISYATVDAFHKSIFDEAITRSPDWTKSAAPLGDKYDYDAEWNAALASSNGVVVRFACLIAWQEKAVVRMRHAIWHARC